jgi:FkbM family methyltransferase
MHKLYIKRVLQKMLGFNNYLFIFSLYSIYRQRLQGKDSDFNYFLLLIPEKGNILDIGSNVGTTAIPLAKKVRSGKVFCFEPISQHVHTLKKIIRYFRITNVEIFETALGEENGVLTMVRPEYDKVKFQGFTHVVEKEADGKKGELFIVPAQRLDDIIAIQDLPAIHAIKIDVENFEYHVLKGAENLIRRHKPLIYCELWSNEKRNDTIRYLKEEFGYRVMIYENYQLADLKNQSANNYFFI